MIFTRKFWRGYALGALLAAVLGAIALATSAPATAGTRHPVILLVPRSQVVSYMQHGFWCTRHQPGTFECTPAAPR